MKSLLPPLRSQLETRRLRAERRVGKLARGLPRSDMDSSLRMGSRRPRGPRRAVIIAHRAVTGQMLEAGDDLQEGRRFARLRAAQYCHQAAWG